MLNFENINNFLANDGPVCGNNRRLSENDGPVRTYYFFFRYAIDRNSTFVMLSSMRVAIVVASLYDITISATESQFG